MRWLGLLVVTGCALYDGKPGNGHCQVALEQVPAEVLIDPSTLQCVDFSSPGGGCDPACGPCPVAEQAPIPSWGSCNSQCTGLDQTTCTSTAGCRIALDWAKYYTDQPSFIGCFATDQIMTGTATCAGLGAEDCSRADLCTGLYETTALGSGQDMHAFKECIPEGQLAGSCTGNVLCDLAVTCPAGTTPGIQGNCFTGACIPDQFCPP